MAIWTCRALITEEATVCVEADTAEEDRAKFDDFEWLDGWNEGSEIVDWQTYSPLKKEPE